MQYNNYEKARTEWDFEDIIDEKDTDFVEQCELCNQVGLKSNYIISNSLTSKKLKVGSSCIRRFILLRGTTSQEESNALFDYKKKQLLNAKKIQAVLHEVLSDLPSTSAVVKFKSASKDILGTLDNKQIEPSKWKQYINLLFGKYNPKKEVLDRVRMVLFGKVKTRKQKFDTGEEAGRWANTMKVKKRVTTTLSDSEAYHSKIG